MKRTRLLTIVDALRFTGRRCDALSALTAEDWRTALELTDRAHLTLALGVRCGNALPEFVRDRIDCDLAHNAERHAHVAAVYEEIAAGMTTAGIEYVFLKGISQFPYYVDDIRHRPQYDIDLYCRPGDLSGACSVLQSLGFESVHGRTSVRSDHLPAMIRKTGWRWRGDYFDPELPPSVELHFRFWDRSTERFNIDGLDAFWDRRSMRCFESLRLPALSFADGLSYTTLHLLRHLLRGDLRPYHVYELAHFLHRSAGDDQIWYSWLQSTQAPFRELQGIAFRLAVAWFGCDIHQWPRTEALDRLPEGVENWFQQFAFSPATALERPNKDELLLHLRLLRNRTDRLKVICRRVLSPRPPRVRLDPHVPSGAGGLGLCVRRTAFATSFLAARVWHHVRTAPSLIGSVLRLS